MGKINIILKGLNREEIIEEKLSFYDIMIRFNINKNKAVTLCKFNNEYRELLEFPEEDGTIEFISNDDDIARDAYVRTLQFILVKAVHDVFNGCELDIEHSLSKGIYCEIKGKSEKLTGEDFEKLELRMRSIINEDSHIEKENVTRTDAIEIFKEYNMNDKVMLLQSISRERVELYKLQGRYDYFYGKMAYSTGAVNLFEIRPYNDGFILRFPTVDNPFELPPFFEYKKLANIFHESEAWGDILGVPHVGALNKMVDDNYIKKIILINEAFHEKKLANIADMVYNKKSVKLVLIAGPSSAGKTTFTKRLGVQLQVNGLKPVQISMDDFFVDRTFTPLDEDGKYDFESIDALDIELFNKTIKSILEGKETEIPTFNFIEGRKEWLGNTILLPENGLLLIEGIHGLNEKMTSTIDKSQKFKIYINCLTQLNMDNHNRIHTTDVRMLRRMVRDSLTRGYSAEATMSMWASVRRGERKNIYVFENEADVMFNSTLVYELCILKKFALEELNKIEKDSPYYNEAYRLKSFLNLFRDIDTELVPENSLLREFIGGSCFYDY